MLYLVYFYQGGISYQELKTMCIPELLDLIDNTKKVSAQLKREMDRK